MLCISAVINQKYVAFSVDAKDIKNLSMYAHILESPDVIYQISVSKDYLIVTTESPDVRDHIPKPLVRRDRSVNNINAYDWMGNHMWNIGEIVGDIKVPFDGGSVTTRDIILRSHAIDTSKVDETHEFYWCISADCKQYIIDLTEKKLVHVAQTK